MFYLCGPTKKIQGPGLNLLDVVRSHFHSKRWFGGVFFLLLWVRSGNSFPNQYRTEHATNCCSPTAPKKIQSLTHFSCVLVISGSLDKRDWCVFRQIRQNCFDYAGFDSISYCWQWCGHWWHRQNIQGRITST